MVHNTDEALKKTCDLTFSTIAEYTVAPVYMEDNKKGGHEWLIEFEQKPVNLENFEKILDDNLRSLNSDYDAKRYKDMALMPLKIKIAPKDTFHNWLKSKGKLGGQSKIPRLSNQRKIIDELLEIC